MANPGKESKYVLAIDLGTSGPKVALVSSHFEVLAWAYEPTSINLLEDGGAEQDPGNLWKSIKKACHSV